MHSDSPNPEGRPQPGTAAAGVELCLSPRGQREPKPVPGSAGTQRPGVRHPTLRKAGPLPRTSRQQGAGGVGRALTNPVLLPLGRDPAGHGGDVAPQRRLRRLQLLRPRQPPCRAPARLGLLRRVPANFADPASRLPAAPRARICSCSAPARGHLLGRAAAPRCAPLPAAPPRPLPPAAPSAHRGRLRAPTRGRPASPARPGALRSPGSASRTSRERLPRADWSQVFFSFGSLAVFPAFLTRIKPLRLDPGGGRREGSAGGAGHTQGSCGWARSAGSLPLCAAPLGERV